MIKIGNYSYLSDQEGCKIDKEKLKQLCKERKIEQINYIDDEKFRTSDQLGEWIDGWKIQGYWYEDFGKFLYACADAMEGLTKDLGNDQIDMKEEQGYNFTIFFYLGEDDKPKVKVGYVPMDWQYFGLDREGKQE